MNISNRLIMKSRLSFTQPRPSCNTQKANLIIPLMTLLGFFLLWDTQTVAFAEQKTSRPKTAAEKKTDACTKQNTECVNDCRNGTHLPLGSSSDKIRTCDVNCGNGFNRCMAAMRGGPAGAFSGTNAPIMRRGVEGEGASPSPTVPEGQGK
ncbi:MAG: hypothetical protein ACXWV7_05500 [Nitrospira sp.]